MTNHPNRSRRNGLRKADIAPVIRSAVAQLINRANTHHDTALIAGGLMAVAIGMYEEIGDAKFAADILRQLAADLETRITLN